MYISLCIFVCLCLYYANVVKKFYHVNKINQSLQKNNSKWNNGYKSKTIKNKVKVKLVTTVLRKYPGRSPIPANKELNNEKVIYAKKANKVNYARLSQKHEKK